MKQMKRLKRIFIVIAFLMPSMINTGASAASEMPDISEDDLQSAGFEEELDWTWYYDYYDILDAPPTFSYSGKFGSPTVFGGKEYIEYVTSGFSDDQGINTTDVAYIREEDGRIYRYFSSEFSSSSTNITPFACEELVFDFNLEPGDKFMAFDLYPHYDYTFKPQVNKELTVLEKATIQCNGERRILKVTCGQMTDYPIYVIEGIGPLSFGTLAAFQFGSVSTDLLHPYPVHVSKLSKITAKDDTEIFKPSDAEERVSTGFENLYGCTFNYRGVAAENDACSVHIYGTRLLDGKLYAVFVPDNGMPSLYLRQDAGNVYRYVDNSQGGEAGLSGCHLVYGNGMMPGETFTGLYTGSDGKTVEKEFKVVYRYGLREEYDESDNKYSWEPQRPYDVSVISCIDNDKDLTFTVVRQYGSVDGGMVGMLSANGMELVSVTGPGGTVFSPEAQLPSQGPGFEGFEGASYKYGDTVMTLIGEKQIGYFKYYAFRPALTAADPVYLREDEGRYFRYLDEAALADHMHLCPGDYKIYDFTKTGNYSVLVEETVSGKAPGYSFSYCNLESSDEREYNGIKRKTQRLSLVHNNVGFTVVEGFGPLAGGSLQGMQLSGNHASRQTLDLVTAADGSTLYTALDFIESIAAESAGSEATYDLRGHRIEAPVPGQPYIRGGRVYIMRR